MLKLDMVLFEVQSSSDEERVGEITIYYETFTLGRSLATELVFDDTSLENIHLVFIHKADGLFIKSQENSFYHSNGKKVKGAKLHRVGDTIKIGTTVLQIKNLDFKNLSEDFASIYKKRIQLSPEQESLIVQLQKEILFLESQNNV